MKNEKNKTEELKNVTGGGCGEKPAKDYYLGYPCVRESWRGDPKRCEAFKCGDCNHYRDCRHEKEFQIQYGGTNYTGVCQR